MNEWISVKDRYPTNRTPVLTVNRDHVMRVGSYDPDCTCSSLWHGLGAMIAPSHWMPLPDPPEELP